MKFLLRVPNKQIRPVDTKSVPPHTLVANLCSIEEWEIQGDEGWIPYLINGKHLLFMTPGKKPMEPQAEIGRHGTMVVVRITKNYKEK